jgi:hypothetical protein
MIKKADVFKLKNQLKGLNEESSNLMDHLKVYINTVLYSLSNIEK